VAGETSGANGAWDGAALVDGLKLSAGGVVGEELSGEALGAVPPGFTLKSNGEEAGVPGVPLSEGAGVSDDWTTWVVPVSVPGVADCANATEGKSGATITTRVNIANAFDKPFLSEFTFIKKAARSAMVSSHAARYV
jgi:hypothetical protein